MMVPSIIIILPPSPVAVTNVHHQLVHGMWQVFDSGHSCGSKVLFQDDNDVSVAIYDFFTLLVYECSEWDNVILTDCIVPYQLGLKGPHSSQRQICKQ